MKLNKIYETNKYQTKFNINPLNFKESKERIIEDKFGKKRKKYKKKIYIHKTSEFPKFTEKFLIFL